MLGAQGKTGYSLPNPRGSKALDEVEEDGEAAQLRHTATTTPLSCSGLSASHPYANHCRAALGVGSTGSLIHQSLGRAQGPSCLGPSFQLLNLLEFVLRGFHFILVRGKVLILALLPPAVAFFPVNIQVVLERKKQLQLVGEESWPVVNDT